jgi:hypothetical protein
MTGFKFQNLGELSRSSGCGCGWSGWKGEWKWQKNSRLPFFPGNPLREVNL